jgi:hypothetical protein
MFDSIHLVRWLEQFSREKIDFELIPSSPHRRTHQRLRKLLEQSGPEAANFKIPRGVRILSLPIWVADRVLGDRLRSLLILSRIKRLEPDYLHAIEIQHAGYPSRKALERLPASGRPVFVVTNYGSDIFWFMRHPRHAKASVFIGLSLSDGISTSMLEAMAMGAIPVQTSTACCDEWFTQTGVKVEDISVEEVAKAILRGMELANEPSNRIINRETIRSKASEEYVRDAALEFYR